MKPKESFACPSSRAKAGSSLLGVRQHDGTVAILPQLLPVDEQFMNRASRHDGSPGQRFRFTNKCIAGGCKQWNGKECSVAQRVVQFLDRIPPAASLAPCPIRATCRWFAQQGPDACRVCSYVITEITEEEIERGEGA